MDLILIVIVLLLHFEVGLGYSCYGYHDGIGTGGVMKLSYLSIRYCVTKGFEA
jgi:hypothetical protein